MRLSAAMCVSLDFRFWENKSSSHRQHTLVDIQIDKYENRNGKKWQRARLRTSKRRWGKTTKSLMNNINDNCYLNAVSPRNAAR